MPPFRLPEIHIKRHHLLVKKLEELGSKQQDGDWRDGIFGADRPRIGRRVEELVSRPLPKLPHLSGGRGGG